MQEGQYLQAGQSLFSIVLNNDKWVVANFKETQLRHMRLGQEVELRSDLYGGDVKYKGRITSLGLGTGSAFSLLPATPAKGNVFDTDVYARQLHDADAMIHSIIQDNLPPSARAS